MAEQHSPIIEFPRGKYIGRPMGDPPKDEAERLYRCPACGGSVDCRDLGQVFDHQGPLPHPAEDWCQQNLIARKPILRDSLLGRARGSTSPAVSPW
jgi:hypothetical protein